MNNLSFIMKDPTHFKESLAPVTSAARVTSNINISR